MEALCKATNTCDWFHKNRHEVHIRFWESQIPPLLQWGRTPTPPLRKAQILFRSTTSQLTSIRNSSTPEQQQAKDSMTLSWQITAKERSSTIHYRNARSSKMSSRRHTTITSTARMGVCIWIPWHWQEKIETGARGYLLTDSLTVKTIKKRVEISIWMFDLSMRLTSGHWRSQLKIYFNC